MTYRAICSSCMKANEDESADRCPACNSRRLVIVSGDMEGRAEYRRRQKEREAAAARRRAARPAPVPAAPGEPKPEPEPEPGPPAAREAAPASPGPSRPFITVRLTADQLRQAARATTMEGKLCNTEFVFPSWFLCNLRGLWAEYQRRAGQ